MLKNTNVEKPIISSYVNGYNPKKDDYLNNEIP
jgi:hypothetical protein